jgi:hypothetical protein
MCIVVAFIKKIDFRFNKLTNKNIQCTNGFICLNFEINEHEKHFFLFFSIVNLSIFIFLLLNFISDFDSNISVYNSRLSSVFILT